MSHHALQCVLMPDTFAYQQSSMLVSALADITAQSAGCLSHSLLLSKLWEPAGRSVGWQANETAPMPNRMEFSRPDSPVHRCSALLSSVRNKQNRSLNNCSPCLVSTNITSYLISFSSSSTS